jgi:two-component system, chemotaxis family, CheB/CheR fusion protein
VNVQTRSGGKIIMPSNSPNQAVDTIRPAADTEAEPNPQAGRVSFPIVGVGASAGGLEAFTQLLKALPVDAGMSFVLVQHLAASHPSALAEILSRGGGHRGRPQNWCQFIFLEE